MVADPHHLIENPDPACDFNVDSEPDWAPLRESSITGL